MKANTIHALERGRFLDRAVRKAFLSGIGSKLVVIVLGVLSLGLAARGLDVVSFGIVATLVGLMGIFGFMDFGIGNGLIHKLAQRYAQGDVTGIRSALANALVFLTVVAVLLGVTMVALIWIAPESFLFGTSGNLAAEIRMALTVFSICTAIVIPSTLGSRLALGIQRGYLNNFTNLVAAVLSFVATAAAYLFKMGIVPFTIAFVAFPALTYLVQSAWLFCRNGLMYLPDLTMLDWAELRTTVSQGLPFMALGFAGAAAYQTDSLIVMYIVGAAGAGVFGLLVKVFTGLTALFAGGLQQLWASTAHALATGDLNWVKTSFRKVLWITTSLFVAAAIGMVVFGQEIVKLWAGGSVVPNLDLLIAFAVWYSYNFALGQFSMLLNGANIVGIQALTSVLMAIVNIPLSIFLTSQIGLPGPLYGSLISHVTCVGVPTIVLVMRLLRGSPKSNEK